MIICKEFVKGLALQYPCKNKVLPTFHVVMLSSLGIKAADFADLCSQQPGAELAKEIGFNPKQATHLLAPMSRKQSHSSNLPPTEKPDSSCTYVCIECTYPVKTLYTRFASADDRKLGRGFQLTQCPRCKRFADKYVEHDFVVLFIDLVLIKPQVS